MKKYKGISLIVLVITIIVIIILAGAVILSLSQNNPIASATQATFKTTVDSYNSQLALAISKKYEVSPTYDISSFYARSWDGTAGDLTGSIKDYISSITSTDALKYVIAQGKLEYIGTDVNEVKLNGLKI